MTSPDKQASNALILRPPPPARAEIAALQTRAGGDAVPEAALGLTICWFGYEDARPAVLVAEVRAALAGFAAPPRRVLLDRMVASPAALLLRPSERLTGLDALAAALGRAGVAPAPSWHLRPQLTIARGPGLRPVPLDPVSWTADTVELVRNRPGHLVREPLGRWSLASRATA